MLKIPLTLGKVALIDNKDEWVTEWKWYASKRPHTYYVVRNLKKDEREKTGKHTIYLHQQLIEVPDGFEVDHKDRNGLNNRRKNLRLASSLQNAANKGMRTDNTSGVIGVNWDKRTGSWRAELQVNREYKFLGRFANLDEAIAVRKQGELLHFGEFAP